MTIIKLLMLLTSIGFSNATELSESRIASAETILARMKAMKDAGHLAEEDYQRFKKKTVVQEAKIDSRERKKAHRSVASAIRTRKVIKMVNEPIEVSLKND